MCDEEEVFCVCLSADFTSPATEWLDARGAKYTKQTCDPHALVGRETLTACTARQLNIPEETILKTLIFEDGRDKNAPPIAFVLPGTHNVDKVLLSRAVGLPEGRTLRLCRAERAHEFTGYVFGGTTPFGLRRHEDVRVFVDSSVRAMAERHSPSDILINGGGLGRIIRMHVDELFRVFSVDGVTTISGPAVSPPN